MSTEPHAVTVHGPNRDGNWCAVCACGWSGGWEWDEGGKRYDEALRDAADHRKDI